VRPIENGKKLRELRGERSVREVSDAVGISESALLMYERGERNPRDDIKESLAEYYSVGVGDIFYPNSFTKRED
jgi:transcriptional regulator with XRE-family HTH domain